MKLNWPGPKLMTEVKTTTKSSRFHLSYLPARTHAHARTNTQSLDACACERAHAYQAQRLHMAEYTHGCTAAIFKDKNQRGEETRDKTLTKRQNKERQDLDEVGEPMGNHVNDKLPDEKLHSRRWSAKGAGGQTGGQTPRNLRGQTPRNLRGQTPRNL